MKKLEDKVQKDGGKVGEHEREVEALRQEVPELKAKAEALAGQLKQAEEVRWRGLCMLLPVLLCSAAVHCCWLLVLLMK